MKTIFITLITYFLVLIIGCEENSIIDPMVAESVNKVQSNIPDPHISGIIPLRGVLSDPHHIGNSFYRISGQIEYEFRASNMGRIPPTSQRHASLYFETNADFQYYCTVCSNSEQDNLVGYIQDVSEDYVALGGNYVTLLEKTFTIQGRDDKMVLKTRFLVTNNRVELSAMWLALPNANAVATEIININQ